MGWSVGWDPEIDRFRGYGVPAFCDAKAAGCTAEINRGLAYGADGENDEMPHLFVCGDHDLSDVDQDDLPGEHPDWLRHVLTDASWEDWRSWHVGRTVHYREQLEQHERGTPDERG